MVNYLIKKTMDKVTDIFYPGKLEFNKSEMLNVIEEIGNPKYTQKENNRGNTRFRKFVEHLMNQALRNYDNMVLLTGDKGTGKSSAGIQLCREWLRLTGRSWNPNKYIAYTNSQLIHLIETLPPGSPILCDEAINFASSENWNKPENKKLKVMLGTVRTKHLFFILCLPWKIKKLDKVYFDSYVNYWIDLYARGIGAVFIKDRNPSGDPWKLKAFQDLGSYNEFTTVEQIEKKLRKHPNFWALIKIAKVPKKIYDDYLIVRESNIYNNDNVMTSVTQEEAVKALIIKAFYELMLKGSSFSVKRLRKHFSEKYHMEIPLVLINKAFEDCELLSRRVIEDKTIKTLKR